MLGDVVVTIDVEWAHPEILSDTVRLLDDRRIPATFFCTHEGIDVPGHERAIHPNFRRAANTLATDVEVSGMDDRDFYHFIVAKTHAFCPEAIGTRSHSLITDSDMFPVYRDAGLEYDSSVMLPIARGLAPVWRGSGIVEIPIYYMDHWDLSEGATGFDLDTLRLESSGLKVLVFHPNLIFMNAASLDDVAASKPHYHDPDWQLEHRNRGRGVRTLLVDLLDALSRDDSPRRVLADVNAEWRATNGRPASRLAAHLSG